MSTQTATPFRTSAADIAQRLARLPGADAADAAGPVPTDAHAGAANAVALPADAATGGRQLGSAAGAEGHRYRGRSIQELIPKIQAELGKEAIVTARRTGLEGGIGGFFQRPFVEIEAQPAGPGIDIVDATDALPPVVGDAPPAVAMPAPTASPVGAYAAGGVGIDAGAAKDGDAFALGDDPIGASETYVEHAFADALQPITAFHADNSPVEEEAEADGRQPADSAFASVLASVGTDQTLERQPVPDAYEAVAQPPAPAPVEYHPAHTPVPTVTEHHPAQDPSSAAAGRRPAAAAALLGELRKAGFDESFAASLIDTATTHVLPFASRIGLRRAVRVALEREVPKVCPPPADGALIALVGPGGSGKTKFAGALAGAYGRASVPVHSASVEEGPDGALQLVGATQLAGPTDVRSKQALSALTIARCGGVVVLDTPALSASDSAGVRALGRALADVAADSVVLAIPATLSASAAMRLVQSARPLKPTAVAITHVDESDQLGVAVQAACAAGLAPEFLLTGQRGDRCLTRVEPATLAERLVP
jgi:flagellar biosynthesis GTPase FlhF